MVRLVNGLSISVFSRKSYFKIKLTLVLLVLSQGEGALNQLTLLKTELSVYMEDDLLPVRVTLTQRPS